MPQQDLPSPKAAFTAWVAGTFPQTFLLTALSLLAFAANSVLCRMALAEHHIDAASFTSVRLGSGAMVLGALAIGGLRGTRWPGSVASTAALFAYAVAFSFAYLRLGAGIGALVLFGCVQVTMIGWGIAHGEQPRIAVWIGFLMAFVGLAGLTVPGTTSPDPIGTIQMAAAGVSWAAYSLRGRTSTTPPMVTTAANFVGSLPLAGALFVVAAASGSVRLSTRGLLLAVASGALASGLGYVLWYSALRRLTATRASILQLLVPILAAAGGVALGERPSVRLLVAGGSILVGVAIAVRSGTDEKS